MENDRAREAQTLCGLRAGIALYGQILAGLSLFGTAYAGSPAWLCVLGTAPYLFLCRFLSRREAALGKVSQLAAAAAALLDALAVCVPLCSLCQKLLSGLHPWAAAAIPVGFAVFAAGGKNRALGILSRPAAWFIFLPLLLCAAALLGQTSVSRLFPLLGRGIGSIGIGAAWMCGCVSCACLPMEPPVRGSRRPLAPLLAGLLLGAATAAFHALLLPYAALTRPSSPAEKLTLLNRFFAPAWAWPLLIFALILLLFFALSSALDTAVGMLCAAGGQPQNARLFSILFALFLLPAGAAQSRALLRILIWALPARALLTAGLLLCLNLKKGRASRA